METITAQLNIDSAKAEKKLEELREKIAQWERQLNNVRDSETALERAESESLKKYEASLAVLKEMEDVNARMKAANESPSYTYLQIRDQRAEVSKLKKEWQYAQKAAEKNNSTMFSLEEKIQNAREAAGRYTQQIKAAKSPQAILNKKVKQMGDNVDSIAKRIKGLFKRVLFFSIIAKGVGELRDYIVDVVKVTPAARDAIGRLKGALLTLAQPIVEYVIPVFVKFIYILAEVINRITAFIARLTGKSVSQLSANAKALKAETDAMNGVASATKKANKQLASFDELNVLSETDMSSSSSSSTIEPIFDTSSITEEIGDLDKLLEIIRLIGLAFATWKIGNALGLDLKDMAGAFLTLDGAINLAKDSYKAWTDGLDTDILKDLIKDVAELTAGLYLLGGVKGGAIGLLIGGIALLVLGIKDWIETGELSEEAMIAIVAGLMAIGTAIAVLTGSWIPLIIAAVLSVVTVIYKYWDKIKASFPKDVKELMRSIVNIVVTALNALIDVINLVILPVRGILVALGKIVGRNVTLSSVKIPHVPYLAQGSVVPPNKEFLAMLGDNKKETEVVSPLSTMKQAFLEAMQEGNFGGGDVKVYVGGEQVSSIITRQQRNTSRALGR